MASLSPDPLLSPEFSLPESAGILQELVEVASSATNKQIDAFVTRLADALLGRSAEALADAAEARRCMDAAQLLKKNRYPFYYALSERLAVLLQRETQRLTGSPAVSETELATPPELPPELEIDRKLCLIRGGRAIDPQLALEAWTEADPLNDRERQVLRLAGEGLAAGDIASRLGLSHGTVRNYLSEAIGKLGAGNRIEAFRLARQKGWL